MALSRGECQKIFGAPLERQKELSNSLAGRPVRVPNPDFPWLSLRKEDGYGDTRFHSPVPVEHRLRPASRPAFACAERPETGYPPYNIEKVGEDQYRIVMAVAGFGKDDVEIVQEQNRLSVRGKRKSPMARPICIAASPPPFERHFDLADYVEVTDATMGEGLLVIDAQARAARGSQAAQHPDQRGYIRALGPQAGRRAAQPRRSPPLNSRVVAKPLRLRFARRQEPFLAVSADNRDARALLRRSLNTDGSGAGSATWSRTCRNEDNNHEGSAVD